MGDNDTTLMQPSNRLRSRISRLIEREVRDYLQAESEFEPYLSVRRTEDSEILEFVYPPIVDMPLFQISVKEIPHAD